MAKELKQQGRNESYTYTTFSWLVSLFFSCPPNATGVHTGATGTGPRTTLHCPNETYKEEIRQAIKDGVLTWTAFPFNSELAAYDPSLLTFGINHTHALDDFFGIKRKITFPDRDVPGVTRALIPLLRSNGIEAINESPNGAMYPTNVPPAFVWRDQDPDNCVVNQQHGVEGVQPPSGQDIVVMWWEEKCDENCFQQYPGSDVAVLFDWRGEDSGPNVGSAADVLKLYAQARAKFPNATVRAAGLDDVAESLLRPLVRSQLPILDLEVGDTWAYGIQSDPRKVANVRAAMRHRADFEAKQQRYLGALHNADASPFTWWSNFSRCLLKGFEHTWGLRYDMCYGGGFVDGMVDTRGDPDNPNAYPYNDIPV